MGTWSHTPFGGDTPADFAYAFKDAEGFEVCEAAFDVVLNARADDAQEQEAVAAAEALCRALGRGTEAPSSYSREVDDWVRRLAGRKPDSALIAKADAAMARVLDPGSELYQSWGDGESSADWRASVSAIRLALSR